MPGNRIGNETGVNILEKIVPLEQVETVRLDMDRLFALQRKFGDKSAEDILCRAIEELAIRISDCERFWRQHDWSNLRKTARTIGPLAEPVGMTGLAQVARDVSETLETGDLIATGATLFRLVRVGERSLTAVWDQQDLSV